MYHAIRTVISLCVLACGLSLFASDRREFSLYALAILAAISFGAMTARYALRVVVARRPAEESGVLVTSLMALETPAAVATVAAVLPLAALAAVAGAVCGVLVTCFARGYRNAREGMAR